MSERGVFAVDRGVWEHPTFDNEPLTQREAWVWLIGEASFKERTKRIGSVVLELQRGQVAASLRFLADKWQWSESRVRRFLKRLKTDAMIDAATDAGITVISICNYDKYQKVSLPRDAATDAQTDAGATQERRKEESTEYKELSSLRSDRARSARGSRLPEAWNPTPQDIATADALIGPDRRRAELEKFRDHWKQQPGSKGVKLDWNAAWRNWIRRAAEYGGNRHGAGKVQSGNSLIAAIDRQLASIEAEDSADLALSENPVLRLSGGSIR